MPKSSCLRTKPIMAGFVAWFRNVRILEKKLFTRGVIFLQWGEDIGRLLSKIKKLESGNHKKKRCR